jgi:hypothetical protein
MLKGFLSYEDRIWNKSPEVPIKIREKQQKMSFQEIEMVMGNLDKTRLKL